ncbi:sushi, von Willebrand factor type A, EGF and pentraxin domain-containing protein 1 [Lingula anatina]|uniref:Sushi, von Willebrand factor type A, EGF and pentraxin domain-containing protein 1 n=1 Tax=Lingula anatina TaxID=7574 RepID=A0A1S3JIX9_LINAN|nr:sushi, von Willebrand factor type A, EGF and pentraxin domain-containing protein 1 [Lingula anatina]|eukprot:XP_013410370.1 sushi, von Willebrand factor type A, EGF and pentraxin domain-containing protein 1 [Lingula anatina]
MIAVYKAADGTGFGVKNPGDIEIQINSHTVQTGLDISDGQWHQVTATWTSQTQGVTLYRDGQLVATYSNVPGSSITTGGDMVIGQRHESLKMRRKRAIQTGVAFEGDISRLHIWDTVLPTDVITKVIDCQSEDSRIGNLVAWADVITGIEGQVEIVQPTQCDSVNECSSSPCLNGATCENKIGGYQCHCPGGYTGTKCDINIDDCIDNSCSNGGSCVDGIEAYTCVCPSGFTGRFCQEEIVHGAWGPWSLWSECTRSCGSGMRTRNRQCDNPPPSPGGRPCSGNSLEREQCNTDPCPACVPLKPPVNGFLNCTTTGDLHECISTCQPQYDFSGPALEKYTCSANSSYKWNHQSKSNPNALLPSCGKTTPPKNVSLDLFLFYPFRNCSNRFQPFLQTAFQELIINLTANISCIQTLECDLSAAAVGPCILNINRTGYVATFAYSADIDIGETEMTGAFQRLQPAAKMVQSNVLSGGFRLGFSGGKFLMYEPNSLVISGSFGCEAGSVSSNNTCVLCPRGTFYDDGVCARCAVGSYQDSEGQFDCDQCPVGTTTPSSGSISLQDCV